eukprot:GHVQ01019776.1.p1 GENE.GHVQ01019776.1~~GHVQ01019776.1.p1  ORF type:complete len:123 (-),score=8.79 GHVQ01019776.1:978-1292(-)
MSSLSASLPFHVFFVCLTTIPCLLCLPHYHSMSSLSASLPFDYLPTQFLADVVMSSRTTAVNHILHLMYIYMYICIYMYLHITIYTCTHINTHITVKHNVIIQW